MRVWTSLQNLKPDSQGKTNVIAVAYEVSIPLPTKGTDSLCKIQLIDNTLSNVIPFMLFSHRDCLPDRAVLPEPSIIVVSDVKVQYFAGRPQIHKSYDTMFSFYQPYSDGFTPVECSQKELDLNDAEMKSITTLRDWLMSPVFASTSFGEKFLSADPRLLARKAMEDACMEQESKRQRTADDPESHFEAIRKKEKKFNKFVDYAIPLEKLTTEMYCNLNLQVVGISDCKNGVVLRCYDGTKPPIQTLQISPLHIATDISQSWLHQLSQYTVDISIFDEHVLLALKLSPGDFVSLVNVHCYTQFGYNVPELIIHGGSAYGRGIRMLSEESKAGAALKKRLNSLPSLNPDPPPTLSLSEDVPRSLQTSPTECQYPEQCITALKEILAQPQEKRLYKVRVFVHLHIPDSYANMVQSGCTKCQVIVTEKPPPDKCYKCGEELERVLFFKLSVQDSTVTDPVELLCTHVFARDFLRLDVVHTSADCEPLAAIMGAWCDLHVICKLVTGGNVKMILSHTTIKPTT